MWRRFGLVLGVLFAGTSTAGQEYPLYGDALPVATLSTQVLLVRSKFGQALEAVITRAQQAHAAENSRLLEELETEERDLTEQRQNMTPEEFAILATAFDDKVVRIRRERDAKLAEIAELSETGRAAFEQAVVPLIQAEMQRQGIVYILDPKAVLYSFGGQDLTDAVLLSLDLAFDAGHLTIPEFQIELE